jgi:hypothetical protein
MIRRLRAWIGPDVGHALLCPLGWHHWWSALSWEADEGWKRHCPDCDKYEAER